MGNGTSKNNYKDEKELLDKFTECPICFEDNVKKENLFILSCNHIFCKKCLQKHYIDFFSKNEINQCPLCRNHSNVKELENIYKDWKLTSYEPINWTQSNTIEINNNIFIKRLSTLDLENFPDGYKLLIPFYEINKIEKPLFFHSSKFNILNTIISDDLDNLFCLTIDGILDLTKDNCYSWYNFLKNNFIKKQFYDKNIYKYLFKVFEYSKVKMRFCIRDINNIITYDTYNGTMEHGLKIYERSCNVLFRTYLYKKPDDVYLINELYAICY